jgi:hypothetical protein
MLGRELEAEGANGIDNDNFKLVTDFRHKSSDLLDEPVDGGFISGLGDH